MVLESSFSFLGVGVRPPMPSWGNMISDGLRVWQLYPHVLAAPAIVLAVVPSRSASWATASTTR
jgi:peptide/nickel transport system permease protein